MSKDDSFNSMEEELELAQLKAEQKNKAKEKKRNERQNKKSFASPEDKEDHTDQG